jgi:hypothetical protein
MGERLGVKDIHFQGMNFQAFQNFIVIGRQKNPEFPDKVFSSLIDTVIQKIPTEVAVLYGT